MKQFFILILVISLLCNPLNILCMPLSPLTEEKVVFLLPKECFSLEINESFFWCEDISRRVGEKEGDTVLDVTARARDGPEIGQV